jgi:TonB family protein
MNDERKRPRDQEIKRPRDQEIESLDHSVSRSLDHSVPRSLLAWKSPAEGSWRTPELFLSLAGHALIIGVAAVLGASHVVKDTRRPIVFNVSVVSPATPLPEASEPKGATVVEAKPKAEPKTQTKAATETNPKSAPKRSGGTVKRQGLGARVEGAEALGYSYYLNVILTRINDNWMNPYVGSGKTFSATVVFVIERDGNVRDVKLEKKSGDAAYDAACERALLVTDKLPPLPPEFPGPRLKLHLEFEQKP